MTYLTCSLSVAPPSSFRCDGGSSPAEAQHGAAEALTASSDQSYYDLDDVIGTGTAA